ncbi:unnamed protein product [Hymenolepis diminuta]|uniref:PDZ domain-containing protein n=1 Tax=Hymenolepis diminuta TaxID=6216 RepID=A0A564YDQ0_HYMDI|nr:unnamed protein product [Hymenolepis diminuta]
MDEIENDNPSSDIDGDDHPYQPSTSKEYYHAYPAQSVSFKSEENSANLILSDEKRRLLINHWTNTLDDDIEIIIGEYKLPAENTPLGISVETVASVDNKGNQLDFRHRIVSLKEDGVIAKQTELKPEDEIIEVSGVVVMDKDSYFFTDTLREPRTSGYLVCSRPLHPNSHKAPSSNSDKMAAIYGAPSEENTQNDSVSIEIESGIERGETVSTSDGKISDIRRKFETSLQEIPRESPKLETLPDKVVQPQNGRKMSDEIRRNSSYESHNSSGYSPNYPDGTVEIVVSKIRGELIGITLGASDEADGGFVVTDVTTNGALYRTLHSVPDYRDVRFSLGDVVTELNGKSLRGATLFGVQSLLWDLFSVEGNVSLKFKPKSASKFQIRYPIKTVEEVTISDSESPGVVSSRKSPIHLISGSSQQSSSRSYSVGIRKESIRNDQTPSTLKSSGTMSNENNSSETFNPNKDNLKEEWKPTQGHIKQLVDHYSQFLKNT